METSSGRRPRWAVVDAARGVAILAVIAFHLTWDLGDLGLIGWRIGQHHSGTVLAHVIAGSFLFLVGVSLVLAHSGGIRWAPFWRRELQLVGLALVVTAATWVYQPRQVVTFGILHAIAVISLLTVCFVRLPQWASYAAGVVCVALPPLVRIPGRSDWVSWTGLAQGTEPTLDWQPVLPWIALTFLGIAFTGHVLDAASPPAPERHTVAPRGVPGRYASSLIGMPLDGRVGRALRWLGRHTLAIYLVHQPVLYGALSLVRR